MENQDLENVNSEQNEVVENDTSGLSTYQEEINDEFSIPDEYKNKGWVNLFKDKKGDDLKAEFFKSYDNSQSLIGKKVEDYIKNVDLKNLGNYEDIKTALIKQIAPEYEIPENVQDYQLNDILKNEDGSLEFEYPAETLDYFGDEFKKVGLSKEQGQKLLKSYTDFEIKEFRKHTDPNDLENSIKEMFNEGSEKSQERKTVEGLLKEILSKEDKEFLQQTAPNYTIKMFYQLAKGLVDKYGFRENTTNSINSSKMITSEADRNSEYDRLYNKLVEIDNSPLQKAGQRDEIIKQMRELFM